MSHDLRLTIATIDYDHVRDFRTGAIRAVGIDHIWLMMGLRDIFARFIANREWDVTELSFAKFVSLATEPESDVLGIPVFLSRSFRFNSFYINKKRGIKTPQDLRGKRIGVPEWAQTAAVYSRGWLQHDIGIPLSEIDWVQAGTNEAGRAEKVERDVPAGIRLTRIRDKTLSDMVVSGEIDCAMCADTPDSFGGNPNIVRLVPNHREFDRDFYTRTGIYPIMHVVAIRKAIYDEYPWVSRNLYDAFETSKQASLKRLQRGLNYPVPWQAEHMDEISATFGTDPCPYGIDKNRKTIETFLQYTFEQGIAHRHAKPEEIFAGRMVFATQR